MEWKQTLQSIKSHIKITSGKYEISRLQQNKNKTLQDIYPYVKRNEKLKDVYHGIEIEDPYQWLEDPHSLDTKSFANDQEALSSIYLNDYIYREQISEVVKSFLNYPKFLTPVRAGTKYYQIRNDGLQNQDVLHSFEMLDGTPRIFLDPNPLSEDGTISLRAFEFSKNGAVMAYALSQSGSDWLQIKFRNVRTGQDYPETLYKIKYTNISWSKDNLGIFYSGYLCEKNVTYFGFSVKGNTNQKLYYHRLDTDQDKDVLIAEFPDPLMLVLGNVSDCGNYLLVLPKNSCKNNLIYYAKIKEIKDLTKKVKLNRVIGKFKANFNYVTNKGSKFIFVTDFDAPNYKLTEIDFDEVSEKVTSSTVVVPEHEVNVLCWAKPINNVHLVLCYQKDLEHKLSLYTLTGQKLLDFNVEGGSIFDVTGRYDDTEMFFSYTSYLIPNRIYRIDFDNISPEAVKFHETKILGFDENIYKIKRVFYKSLDGTNVPMTILSKLEAKIEANTPCLLYGYGGFGTSLLPRFNILFLVFINVFKGICAVANVRGGNEFGESWHKAGILQNKQNSFDDFEFAARYLIENKYTKSKLLTIYGISNGGLLAAACMNQSPYLFGAVIINVGVLDMLRFNKFTIGYAWITDYGSPENLEEFRQLLNYSPLHNIKIPASGQYPAVLLITAEHDDRVVPSHSLKFIAELQYKIGQLPSQVQPLILRNYSKSGHGAGKPTHKLIDELNDIITFIAKTLKLKFYINIPFQKSCK